MSEVIRILCVDDEVNVLRALERVFIDEDYEILTAASAEEGLELLKSTGPVQLVISDYRMPLMNGVDFLSVVFQEWPDSVRIVLSGYADSAAIVDAINEGHIYKFVPKPWDDDELKMIVSHALERYYLAKRNRELVAQLAAANEELTSINNNLEKAVAERTAKLLLQNRILAAAQNILDALPVAVIGIDGEGSIVQCNGTAEQLFGLVKGEFLGSERQSAFPPELNEFIDRVVAEGAAAVTLEINGTKAWTRGVSLVNGDQTGVILTFDAEVHHV